MINVILYCFVVFFGIIFRPTRRPRNSNTSEDALVSSRPFFFHFISFFVVGFFHFFFFLFYLPISRAVHADAAAIIVITSRSVLITSVCCCRYSCWIPSENRTTGPVSIGVVPNM